MLGIFSFDIRTITNLLRYRRQQSASIDPTSDFDLTQYLFHENISSSDDSAKYIENYYKKNVQLEIAQQTEYLYRRSGSTISVRCPSVDGVFSQYTISEDSIYAKGVGPVFKDGDWMNNLGRIYSIYDY